MSYEPEAGDVIWSGEVAPMGVDRWPCLVVSEKRFWQSTGMVMVCPITAKAEAFPSSVVFPDSMPMKGEVLTGQMRTLDTAADLFAFTGVKAPPEILAEVRSKLALIVGIEAA